MLAVNRRFDGERAPGFERAELPGGGVAIETEHFSLRYEPAAAAPAAGFTPRTLSVLVKGTGETWRPGDRPARSLHGTVRTLDRVGRAQSLACTQAPHVNDTHCVEGVLSRAGWAVIDDSLGARWDSVDAAWPWVRGPAEPLPFVEGGAHASQCAAEGWDRYQCIFGNRVDEGLCRELGCCFDAGAGAVANGHATMWNYVPWCFHPTPPAAAPGYTDLYVFARGLDFRATLRDFRLLSGPAPQLPRYALGPMFSRWMGYHDHEERDIVSQYARNAVPLDVMIVDMGKSQRRKRFSSTRPSYTLSLFLLPCLVNPYSLAHPARRLARLVPARRASAVL